MYRKNWSDLGATVAGAGGRLPAGWAVTATATTVDHKPGLFDYRYRYDITEPEPGVHTRAWCGDCDTWIRLLRTGGTPDGDAVWGWGEDEFCPDSADGRHLPGPSNTVRAWYRGEWRFADVQVRVVGPGLRTWGAALAPLEVWGRVPTPADPDTGHHGHREVDPLTDTALLLRLARTATAEAERALDKHRRDNPVVVAVPAHVPETAP